MLCADRWKPPSPGRESAEASSPATVKMNTGGFPFCAYDGFIERRRFVSFFHNVNPCRYSITELSCAPVERRHRRSSRGVMCVYLSLTVGVSRFDATASDTINTPDIMPMKKTRKYNTMTASPGLKNEYDTMNVQATCDTYQQSRYIHDCYLSTIKYQ